MSLASAFIRSNSSVGIRKVKRESDSRVYGSFFFMSFSFWCHIDIVSQ
nr:MAG TPA: hypothetical protein [Caudoviricetes sp.]